MRRIAGEWLEGLRGASSASSPRACSCGSPPCCPHVSGDPHRRPPPPCIGYGGPRFSRLASATWLLIRLCFWILSKTLAILLLSFSLSLSLSLYIYICIGVNKYVLCMCIYIGFECMCIYMDIGIEIGDGERETLVERERGI